VLRYASWGHSYVRYDYMRYGYARYDMVIGACWRTQVAHRA